jgi:predicted chitinase
MLKKKYQKTTKYLGNTKAGDGYRFRGRGLIQLTGRGNYQKAKRLFGIDVVNNPSIIFLQT